MFGENKKMSARDDKDSLSNLTDRISSLPVGPEVLVQPGESVLQLSSLGVSQFERNGHGSGQNVSNTKG